MTAQKSTSCLRWVYAVALSLAAWAAGKADTLTVFAAASLSDALTEIGRSYETASGDTLHFNFGASSLLARQIKEGAPADLFFSADEAKMDDLVKGGLIASGTRRTLLSNSLAIVVPTESRVKIESPTDLASTWVRRLALGETQTVPAGVYAKAFLQQAGLWEKVSAKVIPTENVRAALAVVENGNAEAGIVYVTDVFGSKKVRIAYVVPVATGPRISYPLAILEASKRQKAAERFAAHLSSSEAWAIFSQYGFLRGE